MPHASSGWSRLACATMASYVAWSIVNTPTRLCPAAVRPVRRWPGPHPETPGRAPSDDLKYSSSSQVDQEPLVTVPLYQAKAEFFRTLGHPARIRVLELLAAEDLPVHR